VYSARRPSRPWKRTEPALDQAKVDGMESPPFEEQPYGEAAVETYTVAFNREGEPEQGIVIGRLSPVGQGPSPAAPQGWGLAPRFLANTPADAALLWSMTREEFVGRRGTVEPDAATGRNVFTPE
jgi:hypothetical protein